MKYLSNKINWDEIKAIGFDLDGTLYDEFDLIKSSYTLIAERFTAAPKKRAQMLNFMLSRWLEKGSSYPYIFNECLNAFKIPEKIHKDLIQQALISFRNHKPQLQLSNRISQLLLNLFPNYPLFLLSDGCERLQMQKFKALKLEPFFAPENIHISGKYGKGFEKPNTLILEKIRTLKLGIPPNLTIYIGDRKRDEMFAKNAGFQFCYIQELFNKID